LAAIVRGCERKIKGAWMHPFLALSLGERVG
jgi:hypothetical protein